MKALITGASSGIGWDMAQILSDKGYDIIAVARRQKRLEELKNTLETNVEIVCCDLTDTEECKSLVRYAHDVDILINNAGFGVFGDLSSTDLDSELKMIDTNAKAVHILTKLFADIFYKKNKGYILNVASIASFLPGPLLSTYYSTKSYVRILSESIYGEFKSKKSDVYIGVLCPGPVATEFDKVANVKFSLKSSTPEFIAEYALKKMFSKKLIILPTLSVKLAVIFQRFVPKKLLISLVHKMQKKKLS